MFLKKFNLSLFMNNGKKWLELVNKLESSEGNKILGGLKHLATSQYAFNRNFDELIRLIKIFEEDLSIWSVENRNKLDALQREFLRLLHNYLSSAFSLIQHTYVFKDSLKNDELKRFYSEVSKNFKVDEIMVLIQDLRIYTQHYKLPFSKASISFTRIDKDMSKGMVSKQELLLDRKELLKWKRWAPLSKKYLANQVKDIKLKDLVIDYYNKIQTFYGDLYSKVLSLYKREVEESSAIEGKIIKLQKEMDNKS